MPAAKGTAAQKAEAAGEDKVTFTYDGDEYTVDADLDIDIVELVQAGKTVDGMQAMLGDEQWQRFRKNHSKISHVNALYDAFSAAGQGNS